MIKLNYSTKRTQKDDARSVIRYQSYTIQTANVEMIVSIPKVTNKKTASQNRDFFSATRPTFFVVQF